MPNVWMSELLTPAAEREVRTGHPEGFGFAAPPAK